MDKIENWEHQRLETGVGPGSNYWLFFGADRGEREPYADLLALCSHEGELVASQTGFEPVTRCLEDIQPSALWRRRRVQPKMCTVIVSPIKVFVRLIHDLGAQM